MDSKPVYIGKEDFINIIIRWQMPDLIQSTMWWSRYMLSHSIPIISNQVTSILNSLPIIHHKFISLIGITMAINERRQTVSVYHRLEATQVRSLTPELIACHYLNSSSKDWIIKLNWSHKLLHPCKSLTASHQHHPHHHQGCSNHVLCVVINLLDITMVFPHVRDARAFSDEASRRTCNIHVTAINSVPLQRLREVVASTAASRSASK